MNDKSLLQYLSPTEIIDCDHKDIILFSNKTIGNEKDTVKKAVRLFYAVRDEIRYDPYRIILSPEGLKASSTLKNGYGYCVAKAILLTAAGRAAGIPSRLGFADVRNHLTSKKLSKLIHTDIFAWHGYTEFYLQEQWVKATPAFNLTLCEKTGTKSLDFNGKDDAVFQEFDRKGHKHMEYLTDHGHYQDVPFDTIVRSFREQYPIFYQFMQSDLKQRTNDYFEDEGFGGD